MSKKYHLFTHKLLAVLTAALFLVGCEKDIAMSEDNRSNEVILEEVAAPVTAAIAPEVTQNEISYTDTEGHSDESRTPDYPAFDYSVIPEYNGVPAVSVNGNVPFFTDTDLIDYGYEYYSPLDPLGRCGVAYAIVGYEIMPKYGEVRGEIGMVKPSGWHTAKYPDVIEDLWLYNRSHLIAWALGEENDNECNLITGTRYMNVEGMLPYENAVAEYIYQTRNHVQYRVTPYFMDSELVARGVLMEARSIEDDTICFCVWCYNVQPGIEIDYTSGDSWLADPLTKHTEATEADENGTAYVLNTRSMKCHLPECESVSDIAPHNRQDYTGSAEELKAMGYGACGRCKPF